MTRDRNRQRQRGSAPLLRSVLCLETLLLTELPERRCWPEGQMPSLLELRPHLREISWQHVSAASLRGTVFSGAKASAIGSDQPLTRQCHGATGAGMGSDLLGFPGHPSFGAL